MSLSLLIPSYTDYYKLREFLAEILQPTALQDYILSGSIFYHLNRDPNNIPTFMCYISHNPAQAKSFTFPPIDSLSLIPNLSLMILTQTECLILTHTIPFLSCWQPCDKPEAVE